MGGVGGEAVVEQGADAVDGAAWAAILLLTLGAAARPLLVADPPPAPTFTDAEIGFLQDMTAHHQQALLMVARLSAEAAPPVRTLATQIADAQRLEIGTMTGWLTLAAALPVNPRPMAWMSMPHHHGTTVPDAAMPGMATTAELDELAAATAEPPVTRLARAMFTDQTREAATMTLLLSSEFGTP